MITLGSNKNHIFKHSDYLILMAKKETAQQEFIKFFLLSRCDPTRAMAF